MIRSVFERSGGSRRATVVFAIAMLAALTLFLTLTGSARAAPGDPCHPDCGGGDLDGPFIDSENGSETVFEGQTATNSGIFSDPDGNETVTLAVTSGPGSVTKNDANGTWSWSFGTSDGPSQSDTVTIRATDGDGQTDITTFTLTVNNLAPTATLTAPPSSHANKNFVVSLTNPSDSSSVDKNAGFTYAFDCGTGSFGAPSPSSVVSCPAGGGPSRTVRGRIIDKDGDSYQDAQPVTVNPAPQAYPNGKIAFTSFRLGGGEIYAMNANGSGQTQVTDSSGDNLGPSFSPDGTKIVFSSTRNFGEDIYIMSANGFGQTRLTTDPASNPAFDEEPTFSPDGSKIAFSRDPDDPENPVQDSEIWVMNADGSEQKKITDSAGTNVHPAFSPNGSQIAYVSTRDNTPEIFVANADGSGEAQITNSPGITGTYNPAFSPDGSKIVFRSDQMGNPEIYRMNADGSGQTRLTNSAGFDDNPAFSPDGSKIAFSTNRDDASNPGGDNEVYAMNADGSGPVNLTNDAGVDFDPSWGGAGDTTPPDTSITGGPNEGQLVANNTASFPFSSEANATFECKLDTGSFALCTSPKFYNNLADGQHTFQVRAIDASGNVDASPATRTWTVDTTAPTITGMSPANNATGVAEGANVTVTFSENVDGGTLTTTNFTIVKQFTVAPLAASVGYDSTTNTATLDPTADLASLETYHAIVKGGASGVKDRAGNPLAAPQTLWTFTTADTRLPSVGLTAPNNGATVGGTVQLAATASDNIGVQNVEFFVNSLSVGSDGTGPSYTVNWNTAGIVNGDTARIVAKAFDTKGNQTTSAERTVTVDNAPPDTILDSSSGPSGTVRSTSASFDFSSTKSGSTFECSLDDAEFAACTPLQPYNDLSNGAHTFRVRAVDGAGNVDGTPARRTWTVDTIAPETTLGAVAGTPAEGSTVRSTSATFAFFSETSATFQCSLDGAGFAACPSPKRYSDLRDGTHVFKVRARDAAGNVDSTPEIRRWTVDTMAPTVDPASLAPTRLQTGVPRRTNVRATFSEEMAANTLTSSTFKLQQYNKKTKKWMTVPATIAFSNGGKTATLDPYGATERPLAANQRFRAMITTGAKDVAGNPLARQFTWTFNTGSS